MTQPDWESESGRVKVPTILQLFNVLLGTRWYIAPHISFAMCERENCCRGQKKKSGKSGTIIKSVLQKLLRMRRLGFTLKKLYYLNPSPDRMCTIGILGRQLVLTSTMASSSKHPPALVFLSQLHHTHTHTHTHTYIPIHLKQQSSVLLLRFPQPSLRRHSAATNTW